MNVACISCAHKYELDERRLPATGLKMRCPKCGTTFLVFPDGRTEAAAQKNTVLGGQAAPAPVPVPVPATKPAVPGPSVKDSLDLPRPVLGSKPLAEDLDLPAPRGAVPKPPPPKVPIAPPIGDDLDLPAPRGAVPKPPPPKVPIAPPIGDDFDLPAPRGAVPKPPPPKAPITPPIPDDLDLPAPRGAAPKPAAPKAPIAPPIPDDLDLPAPRGAAPKPTAPKAPIAPPIPDDLDLPAPRGAAPKPGAAKAPIAPPLDLDLPAPRGAAKAPVAPPLDLDLPAPRGAAKAPIAPPVDADLPAPRGGRGAPTLDELDLPAPRGGAPSSGLELDLPAPRGARARVDSVKPALADVSRTPFDDPDGGDLPPPSGRGPSLELDLPAPKGGADLPAPKGRVLAAAQSAFGDLDLPMPKRGGAELADLPAPREGGVDLPAPRAGSVDLPAPRAGSVDLPAPRAGHVDLPAPLAGGVDLPVLRDGSDLPQVRGIADLPTPRRGGADLPTPGGDGGFPDLDLPPPRAQGGGADKGGLGDLDLPPPRARAGGGGLGDDLDLPPPRKIGARASASELELPLPEQRSVPPRGHGEIDLPEGRRGDDMEFADIPQERGASLRPPASGVDIDRTAPPAAPKTLAKPAPIAKPRSRRGVLVAVILLVLIAGAGGALAATPYGLFGVYFLEQYTPAAGDPAAVRAAITQADERFLHDTPSSYREALRTLATARHDAYVNRELLSRSLFVESMARVRFGNEPARAAGIRARMRQRDEQDPVFALGIAADEYANGRTSGVAPYLARARTHAPTDPFVDLLDGEVALAEQRSADAAQAFQAAIEHGGGAAAHWGLARALHTGDDVAPYDAAIAATLEAAPDHVEALFARAERLHATGDDTQAITLASQVVGREPLGEQTLVSHAHLRAEAWSLLGAIYEIRGRTGQALEAYEQAADADSNDFSAVLGEGRMLLIDRPSDALGRFEAVIGAGAAASSVTLPSGRTPVFEARLGAARAMMQIDRVQEAHTTLTDLAAESPDDAEVQLWLGHVEEQLEHDDVALAHYQESVRLAPHVFDGYLALARLHDAAGRPSDAVAVLESARSAVPESAQVHEELGTYALSQNRLPEAEREFRAALALDDTLPGARFGLAVVLRRAGRLDEASQAFEQLAAVDPTHPGLALERGLLFEARHEEARAVEFYRAALEEHPNDSSLLLRLGGAQVAVGDYDAAEQTLTPVLQEVPPHAEAEYFAGRISYARELYPDAAQHFARAISLDATRGEFYMWAGRAALANNDLGLAISRSNEALDRDSTLADAYFVRGDARRRSGAVQDALVDLQRAEQLSPTNWAAIAAEADCYDQLRQLSQAIDAYGRAANGMLTNGEWWYELGRLQLDASHTADAAHSLARAVAIGDVATPRPAWLADANRILGDAQRLTGSRAEAIQHYQRYLEIDPGGIDAADVRRLLLDMGAAPTGG
ncbi:MAG: tetratricopeptide repeat protein [Sandaracinus sp.]